MAKNKRKEKTKEPTYNSCIRNLTLTLIKKRVKILKKNSSIEELFEMNNLIKEWYKEIKGEFIIEYVDYMKFCELIDITIDLYSIYNILDEKEFDAKFKIIRNKLAEKLIKEKCNIEYFIAVNRLCSIFDNIGMRPEYQLFQKIEPITSIAFLFSLNISTYLCKLENKKILKFEDSNINNTVKIKYKNIQLLTIEELNNINMCYLSNNINNLFLQSVEKIMTDINKPHEAFMMKDLAQDFKIEEENMYRIPVGYEKSPFNDYLIDINELKRIPKDRLYLTPKGGVKFEIIDKRYNIDSIDMMEEEDRIYFTFHIINKGDIDITDAKEGFVAGCLNMPINTGIESSPYREKILSISILIEKNIFKEDWDLEKVMYEKKTIGCNLLSTPKFLKSMAYSALCCIYLSYYNPFKFKNDIKMYNLLKNKKGGYTRSDTFRIAHLRKLPRGYSASKEALMEAKKAGFENIPEGYTFVNAYVGKDNSDKKAKKKKIISI